MAQETITVNKAEYDDIVQKMNQLQEENVKYNTELAAIMKQLSETVEKMNYNSSHPVHTVLSETKESIKKAIKWCDETLVSLHDKMMDYTEKIGEMASKAKDKTLEVGHTVISQSYSRAIDRLTACKDAVVGFKNSLLSKLKNLATKSADAVKDGLSHIKEFVYNTRASLDEKLATAHEKNAKDHEATLSRIHNYREQMHTATQAISNAMRALKGKPPVEKPFKETGFFASREQKLIEKIAEEKAKATEYRYKEAANHIKANIQADNREFRHADLDDVAIEM